MSRHSGPGVSARSQLESPGFTVDIR